MRDKSIHWRKIFNEIRSDLFWLTAVHRFALKTSVVKAFLSLPFGDKEKIYRSLVYSSYKEEQNPTTAVKAFA